MHLKKRNIADKVKYLLSYFPVVVILGARQSGKSTLAKIIGADWKYFDLENIRDFDRITGDPILFFRENQNHIIIDEVQKSPQLFETLRGVIDQSRQKKGRFILTGSASFELLKNISESLAGRVGIIELSGFKMNEILDQPMSKFYSVFENKITADNLILLKKLKVTKSIKQIKDILLSGGYPEPALANDTQFHSQWMENYFNTYISRDMRDLFPKIDLIKYRRVVNMLSSLSGTIINKSEVARSAETSEKTIRDYMDIISGTYFWRDLPSFLTPKVKTTIKMPKGYFRDSGLALFLQNIDSLDKLDNYPRLGHIFECFVIEEVIRGLQTTSATKLLFSHYRTRAGQEIDLILEGSFGILPVEIKYSSHTTSKEVKALNDFVKIHNLPYGIVLNNSSEAYMVTENIIQIPLGAI